MENLSIAIMPNLEVENIELLEVNSDNGMVPFSWKNTRYQIP